MKSSPHYGKQPQRTYEDMTKKEFMIQWAFIRGQQISGSADCERIMKDAGYAWDVLQSKLKG